MGFMNSCLQINKAQTELNLNYLPKSSLNEDGFNLCMSTLINTKMTKL